MKIAITSTGTELISDVDPRFGRAKYFIIVDPETVEYKAVENRQNLNLLQGAGIQTAKTVLDQKVNIVISGSCGPKAFAVLNAAGIKIITSAEGRVIDAISQYKSGDLKPAERSDVEIHWFKQRERRLSAKSSQEPGEENKTSRRW